MAKSSLYNKISEIQNLRNKIITSSNLKNGVNVFGINGNFTNDANAISYDIVEGKTAYSKGQKLIGTLQEFNNTTINIPFKFTDDKSNLVIKGTYNNKYNISTNQYEVPVCDRVIRDNSITSISYNQLSSLLKINPIDIKKDVKILDITGQYDASTEFQGIKMDPVKYSETSQPLVSSITEISGLDMTQGGNVSNYFRGLNMLKSVSNISAPNVTNLSGMFSDCYNLKYVSNLNFYNESSNKIVNCYNMFYGCASLININEQNIKLPANIGSTFYMFTNCRSLQIVDLNRLINNANPQYMFMNCTNLQFINNIQFINCYSFAYCFYNCPNLKNLNNISFTGLNNGYKINAYSMFDRCHNLNFDNILLNNCSINNTAYMFNECKNLTYNQVTNIINSCNIFYLSNGTFRGTGIDKILTLSDVNCDMHVYYNMVSLYANCDNIKTLNLSQIWTQWERVELNACFYGCSNLESITGELINVASVDYIFQQCTNLKTFNASLGSYSMNSAFYNCTNLTSIIMGPNSNHRGGNLSLNYMFYNCTNLVNINNLDFFTNGLLNCINYGFYNCHNLKINNNINLNIVGSIDYAFYNCSNITGNLYINLDCTTDSYYYSNTLNNAFTNIGSRRIDLNFLCRGNYHKYAYPFINCSNLQYINLNLSSTVSKINAGRLTDKCYNLIDMNLQVQGNNCTWVSITGYPGSAKISNQMYINLGNYAKENLYIQYIGYSDINKITIEGVDINKGRMLNIGCLLWNCNNLNSFVFNTSNNITTINQLTINNCVNLSNSVIDNIIGIVATHTINDISIYNTNNISRVSKIFNNCNITDETLANLPNTAKLLAKGWQIPNK